MGFALSKAGDVVLGLVNRGSTEPVGGWRGRSGTRPTLSTPRALDQRDPRLLSLQRSLEPKFVGRWGPNIARAFLLLRGTWESLDSATALRPTAENGKRDTFPVPASRDLVPVGGGKAISSVSRSVKSQG